MNDSFLISITGFTDVAPRHLKSHTNDWYGSSLFFWGLAGGLE